MAIELKFTKSDNTTPWGFRLVGGVDYEQPLVVVKVIENSIADKAGLCVGDIIVRVNETPTAGLTHSEAHDLIHSAATDFIFAVRRGAFTDILIQCPEEDYNSEFEAILNATLVEEQADNRNQQTHQEPVIKPSRTKEEQNPPVLENLAGQEQVLTIKSISSETKWSTFLQKPKTAVPTCKKRQEERKIIGEPYRVKIVKQPKKSPEERRKVKFQPVVTELEYTSDHITEESVRTVEHQLHNNFELEVEVSATEIEETQIEISEMDEEEQEVIETQELEDIREIQDEECETLTIQQQDPAVPTPKPLDIQEESIIESSLSLEEQLAAVQKQLLALSRLPSAIQVTLEAVTEQLNKIVHAKMSGSEEENEDNCEADEEDILNGDQSTSERAEADITENDNENNISDYEVRDEERNENEENLEYHEEPGETVNKEDEEKPVEKEPEETEEEREAKIMEELQREREEQLRAKKQKEMEEVQRKRDWVTRPILLPGGRKWTDPDDAVPKLRTPKMTDEKICSTIDSFSEVIVGKTKGINFLKFEPPAKNLDYLQRSDVYRMIHDMEPSVSGIGTRAEKILSEEDYYNNKGAP